MRLFLVLAVSLYLFLTGPGFGLAVQVNQEVDGRTECEKCHGFPPLDNSINSDKFYSGAHLAHQAVPCGDCHTAPGGTGHNNGVIDILPVVNYPLGEQVPWPGSGGGSCGGGNNWQMPVGCHTEMKETVCLWLPGDVCKKISAP